MVDTAVRVLILRLFVVIIFLLFSESNTFCGTHTYTVHNLRILLLFRRLNERNRDWIAEKVRKQQQWQNVCHRSCDCCLYRAFIDGYQAHKMKRNSWCRNILINIWQIAAFKCPLFFCRQTTCLFSSFKWHFSPLANSFFFLHGHGVSL